jgi:magnesium-transporting ATPase (P-type)
MSKDPATRREIVTSSGLILLCIGIVLFIFSQPVYTSAGPYQPDFLQSLYNAVSLSWFYLVLAGIGAVILSIGVKMKNSMERQNVEAKT